MDRPRPKWFEGLAAPEGRARRDATTGVYATMAGAASASMDSRDLAIERDDDPEWGEPDRWPVWTDAYRYAVSRAWPDSPAGGAR